MRRKQVWLAIWAMLLSTTGVVAQGPMYPPMPSPYGSPAIAPGYPMTPYGPMPMTPPAGYRNPMMPAAPYGYPPAGAYPMQPMPNPMPANYGNLPMTGANEPLYVLPSSAQPNASSDAASTQVPGNAKDKGPTPQTLPTFPDGPIMDPGPNEPYTLYEGRRYRADYKNDQTRVWLQANYIHWWIRRDSTPPLFTTGTVDTLGTLNKPGSAVLIGDAPISPSEFNGVQAMAGIWLDDEKLTSLEFGGFWLGSASRQYHLASDANGNPILAQPILAPHESPLVISFPGVFAGNVHVNSVVDFHGFEVNLARNLYRLNGWSIDYFAGARYLYLHDNLSMTQNISVLALGGIPFFGVDQGPGSTFQFYDSFDIVNRFYGGQIGTRINWTWCKWDLGAVMKLGMGATAHTVNINGTTTLNATNGTSTTVNGSTLAQASNIGQHGGTDFSVVPELTATLGYQLTSHLRFLIGYNFLYWNRIERVGNQIDRRVDFTQAPTDGNFVQGKVGATPQFLNQRTDFWAQGINVGVEIKY